MKDVMENEKSIIKIEKIVLILIIMCIFGVLSGRIYEFVGQEITNSCFYVRSEERRVGKECYS